MLEVLKRIGIYLLVIIVMAVCGGCVYAAPIFAAVPTSTPAPTATPMPYAPSVTPDTSLNAFDALGLPVQDATHYDRYITFEDIYIYEYGDSTLLDAYCINNYTRALEGAVWIEFTDIDGECIARAQLLTADGTLCVQPGKTAVFARIDTDIDVQTMEFKFLYEKSFMPD